MSQSRDPAQSHHYREMESVERQKKYKDYGWVNPDSGNGESGERLAETLVAKVRELEGIRSICDLGCGNGYLAGRLVALGYDVTGIDASQSGIELAKKYYTNACFLRESLDVKLGQRAGIGDFDLVVSSDVIEHLYRPADLLEAAFNLLKPRGRIIVGTPYHGYWKNLALSLTGRMDAHFSPLWDGGHIKFFSVKTLTQLVGHSGFEIINFSFYGRLPWLWKNMICHGRRP